MGNNGQTVADGAVAAVMSPEAKMAEAALAKFIVDRATVSALDIITSCAVDGCDRWRLFFEQGLAEAIAEENELELDFFHRLCGERGLPYSAQIMDAYLTLLPAARKVKLLEAASLKRKTHPVNLAFYGASFATPAGGYFLDIFDVFVKHGLTAERVDIVATRCFLDLERACNLGNGAFMKRIIPMLTVIPEDLAKSIVSRSAQAENVIAHLVSECGIPVSVFSDQKILVMARPCVAEFIVALEARSHRELMREPVSNELAYG